MTMKAYDILHLVRLSTNEYIPVVQAIVHMFDASHSVTRDMCSIKDTRTLAKFAKELSEISSDIRNGKG